MNQGIGQWVHRRRVKSRGKPAVIHRGNITTYDELAERIDRLATALAARGVVKGDRIAYLGNNHPSFIESLFATASLGAIFVPINTRLAPAEVAYILGNSQSSVLIYARSLESLAASALTLSEFDGRVLVAGDSGAAVLSGIGSELYESFEDTLESAEATHHTTPIELDDPAMIVYTSGTTGKPKGAVLSNGNITWNSLNVLVDYDLTSSEQALMIAPLFHVAALGMGCFATILKGGTVIVEEKFDPGRALELIEQYGVTLVSGVPTTFQLICEHPNWATTELSSLRNLTCGGSAVPTRVLDAYEDRGLGFSQGYGMTETAPGVTSLQPRYSREKAGSVGLPHFFTSVRVADSEDSPVGSGVAGEIQAQGPNVIASYWQNPEATAEVFTADGWLHTGDIGFFDEDGFLYIADRSKDMIISGGENIYSAEVEQAIMVFDEIEAVAVIGLPDERWGEVPHAVVQLIPGAELDVERIKAHLREHLARYKVPATFSVIDEMPRTASGKIRKNLLRA